jgi:hypothetical protein
VAEPTSTTYVPGGPDPDAGSTERTPVRRASIWALLASRRGQRDSGTGSRFRPDVEGLRAVAVGLVVLYHAGLTPVSGGYVGVDVFFVISGFVITTTLAKASALTSPFPQTALEGCRRPASRSRTRDPC